MNRRIAALALALGFSASFAWGLTRDGLLVSDRLPFRPVAAARLAEPASSPEDLSAAFERCIAFITKTAAESASPDDWRAYAEALSAKKTDFVSYLRSAPKRQADFAAFRKKSGDADFSSWAAANPPASKAETALSLSRVEILAIAGRPSLYSVRIYRTGSGGAGGPPPPFPPLYPPVPAGFLRNASSCSIVLDEKKKLDDYGQLGREIVLRELQGEILAQLLALSKDPGAARAYLALLAWILPDPDGEFRFLVEAK
jgi:hypothetical protein